MTRQTSPFHGLLVIDKPKGITSRDAVDHALRWFPRGTRLGHTGTLDPLATGVLVLCVGVATRLAEHVQRMKKVYQAGLRLGARSDTDDADGTIQDLCVAAPPDRQLVEASLRDFVGAMDQVPPAFSAAKISGRRAYDLARRGLDVELRPRRVQIYRIDLLSYQYPRLDVEVHCGKGTYIRSLARDLGERLRCGALIESLRRTRVGPFEATAGLSLTAEAADAHRALLPLAAAVAELSRLVVPVDVAERLRLGQSLPLAEIPKELVTADGPSEIAVFGPNEQLIAVAVAEPEAGCLRPRTVLRT